MMKTKSRSLLLIALILFSAVFTSLPTRQLHAQEIHSYQARYQLQSKNFIATDLIELTSSNDFMPKGIVIPLNLQSALQASAEAKINYSIIKTLLDNSQTEHELLTHSEDSHLLLVPDDNHASLKPGRHRFQVDYRIENALVKDLNSTDKAIFKYNVTGAWLSPIDSVTARLTLPETTKKKAIEHYGIIMDKDEEEDKEVIESSLTTDNGKTVISYSLNRKLMPGEEFIIYASFPLNKVTNKVAPEVSDSTTSTATTSEDSSPDGDAAGQESQEANDSVDAEQSLGNTEQNLDNTEQTSGIVVINQNPTKGTRTGTVRLPAEENSNNNNQAQKYYKTEYIGKKDLELDKNLDGNLDGEAKIDVKKPARKTITLPSE